MQIKNQMGKLTLIMPLPEIIESQKETNNLKILPLELSHIYTLKDLPYHHRDPFDRILVAQAVFEKMPSTEYR
jgi:PIN domain nuclease of toxin-antitoxin system